MKFTEEEIHKIYNEHVKLPEEYFLKYTNVPDISKNWLYADYPRIPSLLDFKEWSNKYNLTNVENLCSTAINDPELTLIKYKNLTHMSYPKYDLHTYYEEFKESFDLFIFCQTLEHLYNPITSLENINKYLKAGGYVFTSVPTLNIPHMTPIHYGGFTPMGLAMLFVQSDFEIIEMGQWGNFKYIERLFRTYSWPSYNELNENNIIHNEEQNVCQCWILARKKI